jgi:hypothetical protein
VLSSRRLTEDFYLSVLRRAGAAGVGEVGGGGVVVVRGGEAPAMPSSLLSVMWGLRASMCKDADAGGLCPWVQGIPVPT